MGEFTFIKGPQIPPPPPIYTDLLSPYQYLNVGQEVEWQIADYTFILAYFLAVVGAYVHLESLSRRTATKGGWNWFYLALSSIGLGGATTSCMQIINETSIRMGWYEKSLQKAYHPTFVYAALFGPTAWYIPVFALILNTGEMPDFLRFLGVSCFAGAGITGSHYLHQLTVTNYSIEYNKAFFAGSFALAIGGYALVLWFMFGVRALYILRWSKQLVISFVLAAVSSSSYMIAALGTTYHAKFDPHFLRNYQARKFLPMVAWLYGALSILLILAFTVEGKIFHKRLKGQSKKLLLASTIFTRDGRVMVQVNGVLPHVVVDGGISESELEKALELKGPLFQWFYRQTRNWKTLEPFQDMLKFQHKAWTSLERVDLRNLDDRDVDRYLEFKLLNACERLSKFMGCELDQMGALYEDICPIGTKWTYINHKRKIEEFEKQVGFSAEIEQGRLLTLVRCIDKDDEKLMKTKGFRFTHIGNISHCFEWFFQMERRSAMAYIKALQMYGVTIDKHLVDRGVYIALLAAKPGIGPTTSAFSVLVPSHCRNRLPMVKMEHLRTLHEGHLKLLGKYNRKPLKEVLYGLLKNDYHKVTGPMQLFIKEFVMSLRVLFIEMKDDWIQDAIFASEVFRMPARERDPSTGRYKVTGEALMFSCRHMIDLHSEPDKKTDYRYELVPMEFLKSAQRIREADFKVFGVNNGRQVLNWTREVAEENEALKKAALFKAMEDVIVDAQEKGYQILQDADDINKLVMQGRGWFLNFIMKCFGWMIPIPGQLPQVPKNRQIEVDTWVDTLFKSFGQDAMNDSRRKLALGAGFGNMWGGGAPKGTWSSNRNGNGNGNGNKNLIGNESTCRSGSAFAISANSPLKGILVDTNKGRSGEAGPSKTKKRVHFSPPFDRESVIKNTSQKEDEKWEETDGDGSEMLRIISTYASEDTAVDEEEGEAGDAKNEENGEAKIRIDKGKGKEKAVDDSTIIPLGKDINITKKKAKEFNQHVSHVSGNSPATDNAAGESDEPDEVDEMDFEVASTRFYARLAEAERQFKETGKIPKEGAW